MVPSGTATKATSPSAQRTSRQSRNAHKHVDEEAHEIAHTDHDEVSEESEDKEPRPSQGTALQSMIIGSLSNQKKRHAIDKKKIKESYGIAKVDLQNNITAFFDTHEDKSEAAHSAQLQRLADLLATKTAIESQMTAKLAHLRALYDTHSKELTTVVGARIKALK